MERRYTKVITQALAVLGFLVAPLYAISSLAGDSALQVLNIGQGASAMSMGGAFSASGSGAASLYYNPAGISGSEEGQVMLGHIKYFQDINLASLAVVKPLEGGAGSLGLSVTHLWMDELTGRATLTSEASGYDAKDTVFGLTYARGLGMLRCGATVKLVNSVLADSRAQATAADLGVGIDLEKAGLKLAAVAQNLGPEFRYSGDSDAGRVDEKLPTNIRLGASKEIEDLSLSLDVDIPNDNDPGLRVGAQYLLDIKFAQIPLRAGYRTRNDFDALDGISAGLGFSYGMMDLDLAWLPYGVLGDTFHISLLLKI